jgi:hypothetical protein
MYTDRNGNEVPIYEQEDIQKAMEFFNKKINFLNNKHAALDRWINEAQALTTYGDMYVEEIVEPV